MTKRNSLHLLTLVAGVRLLTLAHAQMVSSPEEDMSSLRICRASDLPGYWVLVDQAIIDAAEKSKSGILDTPTYCPFQFYSFDARGNSGHVCKKVVTGGSEEQSVLYRGIRDIDANLKLIRRIGIGRTYSIDKRGLLEWQEPDHTPAEIVLCNLVLNEARPLGLGVTPKSGDIILGILKVTDGNVKVVAEQQFRRVQRASQ